jgi:hypothetical protein
MDKAESEAMFIAELQAIDAQKRAGLDHVEVFCQQLVAIVDRYKRDKEIAKGQ